MTVTAEQIEQAHDLYADLGGITSKKMMGGLSIYCDGQIFASIDSEGTYFIKASGPLAEEMEAAGSRIFTFTRKGGVQHTMGYWTLPDDAIDDPDAAYEWARKSLASN